MMLDMSAESWDRCWDRLQFIHLTWNLGDVSMDPTGRKRQGVLVTGVGGGGVGLEIFKALSRTGKYRLFGVDASNLSMGLYTPGFTRTFVVPTARDSRYLARIQGICREEGIVAIAPGSEPELMVLTEHRETFEA